jgi:hypothetical protein
MEIFLRMCVRVAKNAIKNAGFKTYPSQKSDLLLLMESLLMLIKFLG